MSNIEKLLNLLEEVQAHSEKNDDKVLAVLADQLKEQVKQLSLRLDPPGGNQPQQPDIP
jgi:hypothetical protein